MSPLWVCAPLQGPLELCCRRAHCPDRTCASRPHTLSPQAELAFALPGWLIGWDVFCWLGHRRFARHWSVPQLRDELSDTYRIHLSPDAIAVYLQRYTLAEGESVCTTSWSGGYGKLNHQPA
jgi:hypothetical protein